MRAGKWPRGQARRREVRPAGRPAGREVAPAKGAPPRSAHGRGTRRSEADPPAPISCATAIIATLASSPRITMARRAHESEYAKRTPFHFRSGLSVWFSGVRICGPAFSAFLPAATQGSILPPWEMRPRISNTKASLKAKRGPFCVIATVGAPPRRRAGIRQALASRRLSTTRRHGQAACDALCVIGESASECSRNGRFRLRRLVNSGPVPLSWGRGAGYTFWSAGVLAVRTLLGPEGAGYTFCSANVPTGYTNGRFVRTVGRFAGQKVDPAKGAPSRSAPDRESCGPKSGPGTEKCAR